MTGHGKYGGLTDVELGRCAGSSYKERLEYNNKIREMRDREYPMLEGL